MNQQATEPQSASEILRDMASKVTLESAEDSTLSFIPPEEPPKVDPETGIAITRHLSVPLTESRRLELLDELAGHINVAKQLEKLKVDTNATYTKSIKQHHGERDAIGETVAQGIEMKLVACKKHIDYVKGRVVVIRLDTGAVLEDKALEEEDMKP